MIIQSKRIYIASTLMPAQLEVKDGKIIEIYPYGTKPVNLDYSDKRIVPGFYDIHTHGYNDYDATEGGKQGLINWMKYLPSEGVCGFCPTTITQSQEVLTSALKEIAEVEKLRPEGARILGIHFEGPYLDKTYKGAHMQEYIVNSNVEQFKAYQQAADGLIKIITMAVEHDKDLALVKYCANNGVNVSIGHSNATYQQAMMAIANGAKGFTHTFNAMRPYGHRENGVVGAALRSHDTYAEIICDGNHVNTVAINSFFKEKQNHAIIITDSLICKGKPIGSKFMSGGLQVEIYPDGSAHVTTGEKQLAGSTAKINESIKVAVENALVPFELAIDAASINPCTYLGIDDHKGKIKAGYDADLVVLNDDYSVRQTYCEGVPQL